MGLTTKQELRALWKKRGTLHHIFFNTGLTQMETWPSIVRANIHPREGTGKKGGQQKDTKLINFVRKCVPTSIEQEYRGYR